jgi:butyryl-CoA dehydrogenase
MGVRCSNTAELVFEDCRVPADHLIGEENKGFYYLMGTLNEGRVTTAALAVGLARAALDAALAYAKERVQFGAPIGSYQAITFMLANMATEIELARSITYKAAWLTREELPEAAQIASMAKLYASEMVCRVVDKAVQIHGGYGYMREYPVERYYRDARALRFVEGTSEIQRRIIARSLGL